ncbi:hypothetical protein Tco_1134047 [Tanacetum coccineum]
MCCLVPCSNVAQDWYLQRDCKEDVVLVRSGHADKKPDALGRVFALNQLRPPNTFGTITGALFYVGRACQFFDFRKYFWKNFLEYLYRDVAVLTLSLFPGLCQSPKLSMHGTDIVK